jgi:hypothetical protein
MRLGTNDRAEMILRDLIERNVENKKYYYMLEKCLNLTSIDDKTKLYENLIEKHSKADASKQIRLQVLIGNKFFIDLWTNLNKLGLITKYLVKRTAGNMFVQLTKIVVISLESLTGILYIDMSFDDFNHIYVKLKTLFSAC